MTTPHDAWIARLAPVPHQQEAQPKCRNCGHSELAHSTDRKFCWWGNDCDCPGYEPMDREDILAEEFPEVI
jgi:hypothetical protein